MRGIKFGDVSRGTILFPTYISYLEHPARTAEVLELALNVGLPQIYILIVDIPSGKKTEVIWKLRGICVHLNVPYTVVSSRKNKILICASSYKVTLELEKDISDSG